MVNAAQDDDFEGVYIALFSSEISDYKLYSVTSISEIINNKDFHKDLNTVLYIHGFRESINSESVETVVNAFLTRKSHNIMVLDWSAYAHGNYVLNAVPNLVKVLAINSLI